MYCKFHTIKLQLLKLTLICFINNMFIKINTPKQYIPIATLNIRT